MPRRSSFQSRPTIYLARSSRSDKKYMVLVETGNASKVVHFGASGMSDFTLHGDEARRRRYIERHSRGKHENWTRTGIDTAGFWARWLLWNKPTVASSVADIEKQFNVQIEIVPRATLLSRHRSRSTSI